MQLAASKKTSVVKHVPVRRSRGKLRDLVLIGICAGLAITIIAYQATTKPVTAFSSIFEGQWAVEQNPSCDPRGKFYRFTPTSRELIFQNKVLAAEDKIEVSETPNTASIYQYHRDEQNQRVLSWSILFTKKKARLKYDGLTITSEGERLMKKVVGGRFDEWKWALSSIGDLRRC